MEIRKNQLTGNKTQRFFHLMGGFLALDVVWLIFFFRFLDVLQNRVAKTGQDRGEQQKAVGVFLRYMNRAAFQKEL